MKIGTIGYANNSGLGVMLKFFRKHLEIDSQLVIRWEAKGTNLNDLKICNFTITSKEHPSKTSLEEFIGFGLDVVLIIEYPFCWDYLKILKEKGIKIVYIPMIDSVGTKILEKYKDFVDLWLCINKWSYNIIKAKGWKCCYLPYPIDTDYFKFIQRGENKVLLHNAGYVGLKNRKGTDLVLRAFQKLDKEKVKLIINSQVPLEKYGCLYDVDLRVGEKLEIMDLYKEGDIYLAPSRFEGNGLTMYEAMACGFPVITTNAPPMNEVVEDKEFLIKVENNLHFNEENTIYEPDLNDFVSKINFVMDIDLKEVSKRNREIIENKFSWNVLKSQYLDIFYKIVNKEVL